MSTSPSDGSRSLARVVNPPFRPSSSSLPVEQNSDGPDLMDVDEENLTDTLDNLCAQPGMRRVNMQGIVPAYSSLAGPSAQTVRFEFYTGTGITLPPLKIQENLPSKHARSPFCSSNHPGVLISGGSSAVSPVTPSTTSALPVNRSFLEVLAVGHSPRNRIMSLEVPPIANPHIPVAGVPAEPMELTTVDVSQTVFVHRDSIPVDAFDSATDDFMIEGPSNSVASSFVHDNSPVHLTSNASPPTPKADPTYLNRLPVEILENILRQISRRPRQTRWERDISVDDIRLLLCGSGPMTDVAQRKLTGIRISNKYLSSDYLPMAHWNDHLPEILSATGSNLTKIRLAIEPPFIAAWNDNWVHSIVNHCTSVTHLTISGLSDDDLFENLLASRSGQLKTLDVNCKYSKARVASIERHGAGLRKLVVTHPAGDFTNAMRTVGRTLTEIEFTLGFPAMSFDVLFMALKQFCREIRQMKFRGVNRGALLNLADLCVSYGAQLKRVSLPVIMSPELMRNVVAECPNVRVKTRCAASNVVECGRALGARLGILYLNLPLQRPMQHEFQNYVLPGLSASWPPVHATGAT